MLTKKIISDKLSSFYLDGEKIDIISKGSVKNIVIFDKEIVIDLEVVNPTLKSKNLIKENLYNYLKEHLNGLARLLPLFIHCWLPQILAMK